MRHSTRLLQLCCAATLGAALVACATSRTAPEVAVVPDSLAPRPVRHVGPRDPITAAEIAGIDAASAYDAIAKLRRSFLNSRGVNSFSRPGASALPVVFVDGLAVGGLSELRGIPAREVEEIALLSASEATMRFGEGYLAGVIHVRTKR